MASPTRITVIASFQLFPHRHATWHATWSELGRMASGLSACHAFRLLRDPHDPLHCAVVSEWDDAASFNRFVRESHLLWIERAAEYARLPTEFTLFEDVHPRDASYAATTMVERVMRPVAHR